MRNIIKFIPLLIAATLMFRHVFEVNLSNLNGGSYGIIDSVKLGGVVLIVVGISIFFKRNIWIYLFLFGILLAFTPYVSFTNISLAFSIGGLNINLIPALLLFFHLSLNISDFQMPDLTPVEVELKTKKTTNRFLEKYREKSDEDLKRLANEDLIPEAREALNQIMKNKQL